MSVAAWPTSSGNTSVPAPEAPTPCHTAGLCSRPTRPLSDPEILSCFPSRNPWRLKTPIERIKTCLFVLKTRIFRTEGQIGARDQSRVGFCQRKTVIVHTLILGGTRPSSPSVPVGMSSGSGIALELEQKQKGFCPSGNGAWLPSWGPAPALPSHMPLDGHPWARLLGSLRPSHEMGNSSIPALQSWAVRTHREPSLMPASSQDDEGGEAPVTTSAGSSPEPLYLPLLSPDPPV